MVYKKRGYYKKRKKKNITKSAYVEKPPKELHEGGVYQQTYGNSKGLFVELVKEDKFNVILKTAEGMEFTCGRKNFEEFYDEIEKT